MTTTERLRDITARLERHRQAATYAAVAGVVGLTPRRVMATETKSFRNSWVVSKTTRRPTGYLPDDYHPELLFGIAENGVIDSADALADWLETHE